MAGNTPVPDVVDAPTIGTATAGVESATVTFTAATTGGAATSFGAISTPGSITGTSATSPITVSGLTAATAYTFKTYGINSSGTWSNVLSAASNSVTPTASTSYESIATTTVGSGGASNIEFTSIPATYTHLQIRGILQTNRSGYIVDLTKIQFNSDTGTNYSSHNLYGGYNTTPNVNPDANTSASNMAFHGLNSGVGANIFNAVVMDILDYANTNKYKTVRNLQGFDVNGTVGTGSLGGTITLSSGNWRSTNAVTSVKISMIDGTLFNQYSSLALYGIKGA
jgi:hypothetical protein